MENLNKDNFEEKTSTGVVLVDFYADWCGPCKAMAPLLEKLDAANEDVTIVKVKTDDEPALSANFQVRSIPTLVLFVDGEEKARMSGNPGQVSKLQDFIDNNR